MPEPTFKTIPLPDTFSETMELLGQLLQSSCRTIQINVEAGDITTWCALEPGEPLFVKEPPDIKGLFDRIELDAIHVHSNAEVPIKVLEALQRLSSEGFKASFWVIDQDIDIKHLMGWPSLTSISRGFLGIPLFKTDAREFSQKLVVFGTRLQDSTLRNAQAGIIIALKEV